MISQKEVNSDAESQDESDEEYDFIDARRKQSRSVVRQFLHLDLSKQSNATQIAIGSVSGWTTGYVCGKVGKAVAAALGGSILLLHLGTKAGYISVDWDRVNTDMNTAKISVQKKMEEKEQKESIQDIVHKGSNFVSRNVVALGGFVGGFFLGMASG